ncbi:MAG: hypothetical protein ACQ5SW_03390, partial [Sphaerochaetaceae bacterium]
TPLPIKPLRDFMEEFQKLQDLEEDDAEATEILFNCAVIAVQARNKDVSRDELEETLDLATAMQIVQVAGGLEAPNPMSQTAQA